MEFNEKKKIIIGELADYYTIPERIKDLESEIEFIRESAGVKAVQYDKAPSSNMGISHDAKLISMISKIEVDERQIKRLNKKKHDISLKFHLDELEESEKLVIDAVFTSKSYLDAGKKTGYTKKQVYRIINGIYKKLEKYV